MSVEEHRSGPVAARAFAELPAAAYKTLIERAQIGMFVAQDGRFRYVNSKFCELSGYSQAELLAGIDPVSLVVPAQRRMAAARTRERLSGVQGQSYDVRCMRRDASTFSARVHGCRVEVDGAPATLVTVLDTSELEHVTAAEQRRSRLLAQTEELALIGSSAYEVATGLVTQSAGMMRVFGEEPCDEPVSGEWLMERVPAAEASFVRGILSGVRPNVPCEFEHRIRHRDGGLRTVLHRVTAELDEAGNTVRVIGIVQDITAQRAAEQQRDLLARSDLVTGLPNRVALLDHVDNAVHQAAREQGRIALLMMEIGQLQMVSESLGHAAGDQLLLKVAERLARLLSSHDMLAHIGAGRYAVVLGPPSAVDEPAAVRVAEALAGAFDKPVRVDATEVLVRCTIGISLYPADSQTAEKMLHQAETAMRRGQQSGVGRVCVYAAQAHHTALLRLTMETALGGALERGEFRLVYQPQLDLTDGSVIGVEALLRWTDPVRGEISPVEFIPVAEETGLILPIGEWVLRSACAQNVAWQRAGLAPIRVAVNLSVRQLMEPGIASRIHGVLIETGLEPRHLGLEITESMLMNDQAHVVRTLGAMRAIGVEISLDDFGTGYSNLSYLRSLPIDVVKVDRSFVHDITAAPEDVSMTRAIITMAHSLRMKVLAEGVETEGQLALLIANHCDQMQGYYFSRPLAAEAVAQMLQTRRQLPEHLLQRRLRKRTLLLVDDEDNVVAALRRLLRPGGYNIVTANSGDQGLQRLAEHPVDVIVSDQRMPGMTGVQFLNRAKELYPDTVRIVLSGFTELRSVTDAINEGAIYKFLTKPWDDERLRGHIEEAFKHKEMADDNRRLGSAVQTANQELGALNERLQLLLRSQHEQIGREETSLASAQDVLHSIPAPVIGIDADGMIAFVNADAERLFSGCGPVLGLPAEEALPADVRAVWGRSDGRHHPVHIGGRWFQAICRDVGTGSTARGRLLVLTPGAAG